MGWKENSQFTNLPFAVLTQATPRFDGRDPKPQSLWLWANSTHTHSVSANTRPWETYRGLVGRELWSEGERRGPVEPLAAPQMMTEL